MSRQARHSRQLRDTFHALLATVAVLFCAAPAAAQSGRSQSYAVDSAILAQRTITAVRITGAPPRIDGVLDDSVWTRAFANPQNTARDFVESGPRPGSLPRLATIAAFAFDNDALYVAVRAFDPQPELIRTPLPRRDYETTSDYIFVELDTHHDRRNAFSLGVNPRGQQVDGMFTEDVNYSYAWNAVWQAVPRVDSLGWTVEYRIPFSQLRSSLPQNGERTVTWGVNVYRSIPHAGESQNWSPRLPSYGGRVVSHFNDLVGIEIPHEQHALELRPFVLDESAPHTLLQSGPSRNDTELAASAGLDMTAHLPRSLTLDATVRPDFGQVEADPSQINLSSFETFLPEQRPFFVNGTEFFDFNLGVPFATRGDDFSSEQAFYSRRVGAPPHGSIPAYALRGDAPAATDINAAVKVTGRVNGWSIGALAAQTRGEQAAFLDTTGGVLRELVEPRTEFGAVHLSRDSYDGTRSIGLFATGVARDASHELDPILVHHSVFAGVDGRARSGIYELSGSGGVSSVSGSPAAITRVLYGDGHFLQRPGAYSEADSSATSAAGAQGRVTFARIAGGGLTWSITGYGLTPRFDVDDAGFQHNSDWLLALGAIQYQQRPEHSLFRVWSIGSAQIGSGWSFGGERRATVANLTATAAFWNYWSTSLSVDNELSAISTDLLRGGPAVTVPARTTATASVSTDTRQSTQMTTSVTSWREAATHSFSDEISPTISSRLTDKLALTGSVDVSRSVNGWQYYGLVTGATNHSLLARLRSSTASVTARADYAFSPTLTLQGYAQPYFGSGRYDDLKDAAWTGARTSVVALGSRSVRDASGYSLDLDNNGSRESHIDESDFTVRELHGSAVMRWEYMPGSELYLVWTQTRDGSDLLGTLAPRRDVIDLFRAPPRNVFLAKLSYYWQP